jgi:chromosome segregation ATPase
VAVLPTNKRTVPLLAIFLLHPRRSNAKNNLAMPDDITTRPMLEALLEGQRDLASKIGELSVTVAAISQRQADLAAKQEEFGGRLEEFGGRLEVVAAKQDALDARIEALTREVRNGLDDNNRKIELLNKRLLSFETWLSRIDDRLHDEISVRTR